MKQLNKNQSQLRRDFPIQLLLMILLNRQKMGGAAKHVDGPPKLRKLHQFENMLNFTLRVFHLNVSFVTNHSGLEMPCTRINQGVIKKLEVGGWCPPVSAVSRVWGRRGQPRVRHTGPAQHGHCTAPCSLQSTHQRRGHWLLFIHFAHALLQLFTVFTTNFFLFFLPTPASFMALCDPQNFFSSNIYFFPIDISM